MFRGGGGAYYRKDICICDCGGSYFQEGLFISLFDCFFLGGGGYYWNFTGHKISIWKDIITLYVLRFHKNFFL